VSEIISLKGISKSTQIALLEKLGYKSDGIFVLDKCGNKIIDKYTNTPIKLDNMAILPGGIVIDEDSLLKYMEDHIDDILSIV